MSTLAAPVKKPRKLHALQCQDRSGCKKQAVAVCTRCIFTCEEHRHGACCTDLVAKS